MDVNNLSTEKKSIEENSKSLAKLDNSFLYVVWHASTNLFTFWSLIILSRLNNQTQVNIDLLCLELLNHLYSYMYIIRS